MSAFSRIGIVLSAQYFEVEEVILKSSNSMIKKKLAWNHLNSGCFSWCEKSCLEDGGWESATSSLNLIGSKKIRRNGLSSAVCVWLNVFQSRYVLWHREPDLRHECNGIWGAAGNGSISRIPDERRYGNVSRFRPNHSLMSCLVSGISPPAGDDLEQIIVATNVIDRKKPGGCPQAFCPLAACWFWQIWLLRDTHFQKYIYYSYW